MFFTAWRPHVLCRFPTSWGQYKCLWMTTWSLLTCAIRPLFRWTFYVVCDIADNLWSERPMLVNQRVVRRSIFLNFFLGPVLLAGTVMASSLSCLLEFLHTLLKQRWLWISTYKQWSILCNTSVCRWIFVLLAPVHLLFFTVCLKFNRQHWQNIDLVHVRRSY